MNNVSDEQGPSSAQSALGVIAMLGGSAGLLYGLLLTANGIRRAAYEATSPDDFLLVLVLVLIEPAIVVLQACGLVAAGRAMWADSRNLSWLLPTAGLFLLCPCGNCLWWLLSAPLGLALLLFMVAGKGGEK